MYLLGLDLGLTGCKAIISRLDGGIVSRAYREYEMLHPQPSWAVYDPDRLWNDVASSISEALLLSKSDPGEISGVAVASQGETVIPVDGDGRWLYPAMVSFVDRRTEEQYGWWRKHYDWYELYKITGQSPHYMYTVNKIMWLRKHEPNIYKKVEKFLCLTDYVYFKLSGECVTDYSIASRTMMFDIERRAWSHDILDAAKIDADLLPTPHPSGTVVGEVQVDPAKEVGLARGTPVVTGGHDHPCGALPVGVTAPGPLLDSTGTAEALLLATNKPILSQEAYEGGYSSYCHTAKDKYVVLGAVLTAGAILRWFRDEFGREEVERAKRLNKDPYDLLIEKAEHAKPGASGLFLLPHFEGSYTPTMDSRARGAFVGLTLSHTKGSLLRAIIEGICYELRYNVEFLEEKLGVEINELRVIGGAVKSDFWLRQKANVTEKKVVVPRVEESASLGAAVLAGMGVGLYENVEDAAGKVLRILKTYTPDARLSKTYAESYEIYRAIYPSLKDVFAKVSSTD